VKLVVGSFFRNTSRDGVKHYFRQVDALARELYSSEDVVQVMSVEGDSRIPTRDFLKTELDRRRGTLIIHEHGGPVFGSTEAPERFKAMAGVGNAFLSNVPEDADIVLYVESDLRWSAQTMLQLIEKVSLEVDVVAPLVFAGQNFYDVFAFRGLDGQRFAPFPPYHSQLNGFTEVMSVGSCLVMDANVARTTRIPDTDGLVGFCRNARSQGYRIWVDPTARIDHPC
jgi:hypothetical protein